MYEGNKALRRSDPDQNPEMTCSIIFHTISRTVKVLVARRQMCITTGKFLTPQPSTLNPQPSPSQTARWIAVGHPSVACAETLYGKANAR